MSNINEKVWNIILSDLGNEIMPFAATQMDLEIILLSKVSQKGNDKYHMMSHLWYNISKI